MKFFDVSDPRSGTKMRLYDFEWLLAAQMDGYRSLDEIARWAQGELKLQLSAANLSEYADKLSELGFFASADAAQSAPKMPSAAGLGSSVTPLPPHSPGTDVELDEDIPMDLGEPSQDSIETEQQHALPSRTPAHVTAPENEFDAAPTTAKHNSAFAERTEQRAPLPPRPAPVPVPRNEVATEVPPPAKSSSRGVLALLFVLLVLGGVYAYVTWFAPGGAKVSTQVAVARDVVALYDGSTKVGQAPPQKLAFAEAGKVTDVVAVGTEVKAGTPLATLDSFPKVEKELADVKDRLGFYQKQLDAAGAKGDVPGQKAAEEKVSEKKKIATELEAHATKLRLVASGPGVVSKVSVATGSDAKANEPAVELTDKRVVAIFHVPATADLKVGTDATLQAGGVTGAGKVVARDADSVTIEVPEASPLKSGTEVRLAKSKLPGVIVVPASAVTNKAGADTVFVLGADGHAHAHKVKVTDRSGADIYITSGLAAGDQIIVSGGDALNDGDKASAAQ